MQFQGNTTRKIQENVPNIDNIEDVNELNPYTSNISSRHTKRLLPEILKSR